MYNWGTQRNKEGYVIGHRTQMTCSKLKKDSKLTKILEYIRDNNGATKYECVTNVLNKKGSKKDLRGYYCCAFGDLVDIGLLNPSSRENSFKYTITEAGINRLNSIRD